MNYLQFEFDTNSSEAEMLVAMLSNIGFEGFEESNDSLKAFIAEDKFDGTEFSTVIQAFPVISYEKQVVENINWNASWESSFEPVIVHDFAIIRAAFHEPVKNVKHEVIITPKMSFGTGHHATTFLMIEQMAAIDFTNKNVLDFGTGTGVLAILAEKLGAKEILAIDNDDWSIENSKENVAANGCTHITLQKAEEIGSGVTYDIILANINLNVILNNLEAIAAAANTGSTILLSGFLKQDEPQMVENLKNKGFMEISIPKRRLALHFL